MLVDTVRVELTYSSELPNKGRDNYPIVLVPVKRGLMLFNHTERPSETLVVDSFSFLLRQNWTITMATHGYAKRVIGSDALF